MKTADLRLQTVCAGGAELRQVSSTHGGALVNLPDVEEENTDTFKAEASLSEDPPGSQSWTRTLGPEPEWTRRQVEGRGEDGGGGTFAFPNMANE